MYVDFYTTIGAKVFGKYVFDKYYKFDTLPSLHVRVHVEKVWIIYRGILSIKLSKKCSFTCMYMYTISWQN